MNSDEIKDQNERPKETVTEETRTWMSDSRGAERRRGRRMVLLAAAVFVVIVVSALAIFLYLRRNKGSAEETNVVVSVRVARAEKEPISAQVTALGTIFPRDKAEVAAKVSAQIRQMGLLKNRFVRAGEVIAVLESRDLQAQRAEAAAALNEARANERSVTTGAIPKTNAEDERALRDARARVATTRATYERRRTLYEKGGISKKDLEAAQLEFTTAEDELRLTEQTVALRARSLNPNDRALAAAKVAEAQQHLATLDAQLGYATIRAPITGIVTDQFQYQGEFAAAGAKLVNIADISEVIVKAPFADTVAANLKVGDPATVMPTDTSAEPMAGKITLVSRATDPTSRTVEVWVTLGNGAGLLRANGAAQVTISANAKNDAIVVPASAVTLDASNADEGTVMVVDAQSIARETKVTVGIRSKDKIEIVSGLAGGETVVIEGNFSLPDGTKVEIAKDEEQKGGAEKKDEEK